MTMEIAKQAKLGSRIMLKLPMLLLFALLFESGSILAQTNIRLVEVVTSPERTETLKAIISEYEAAHPDVKVEVISLPWGQAFGKLATMVASGRAPDMVEMPGRWLSLYANNDMLLPLEDKYDNWEHSEDLTPRVMNLGRDADGAVYTVPYGFYMRALSYNRRLLMAAGIEAPPATMFDFMEAARKVSELDGKYGYCLRGGSGGINAWLMFAAAMNGSSEYYTKEGKSRLDEPGSIEGMQLLIDLYQKGYAPKDSINWGFKDIVTGFYTGTCAFLDQDPDALIAITKNMSLEDFGVAPMPLGPAGKAFPTIGFVGWSVFKTTEVAELAWDLVAHRSSPENNNTWAKRIGIIPIHQGADLDPFFKSDQYKGWFTQLNHSQYLPTPMPMYLERFSFFEETLALESSRQALLGEQSAEGMARQWAAFLTDEYVSWSAKQ